MGIRPGHVYRTFKTRGERNGRRPNTRTAVRSQKKAYVRGVPGSKLRTYEMGNRNGKFDTEIYLLPKQHIVLRHNALEACRVSANAYLKKQIEETNYFIKVRVSPHHVMREHAQAAIAQADRFYQGMAHPFGKPVGKAALVKMDQPVFSIFLNKENLAHGKMAAKRAAAKLSGKYLVVINGESGMKRADH